MKKLSAIITAFVLCLPMWAQTADMSSVRKKLSDAASRITTMQCDFTQKKTQSMLEGTSQSQGRLYYQQPDKLRWEYTSPSKFVLTLNGQKVSMKSDSRTIQMDAGDGGTSKETLRMLMNVLTGKSLSDNKYFSVAISEGASQWIATLTPVSSDIRKMFKTVVLKFSKSQYMISSVELTEKSGDRIVVEFRNIVTNKTIDSKVFN